MGAVFDSRPLGWHYAVTDICKFSSATNVLYNLRHGNGRVIDGGRKVIHSTENREMLVNGNSQDNGLPPTVTIIAE